MPPLNKLCKGKKDGKYDHGEGCKMFLICYKEKGDTSTCMGKTYFDLDKQDCTPTSEISMEKKKQCGM